MVSGAGLNFLWTGSAAKSPFSSGLALSSLRTQRNGGLGQELVKGLAHELGGHLEVKTSERGTAILVRMPYVGLLQSSGTSTLVH